MMFAAKGVPNKINYLEEILEKLLTYFHVILKKMLSKNTNF